MQLHHFNMLLVKLVLRLVDLIELFGALRGGGSRLLSAVDASLTIEIGNKRRVHQVFGRRPVGRRPSVFQDKKQASEREE
jgi:hypothetical protein